MNNLEFLGRGSIENNLEKKVTYEKEYESILDSLKKLKKTRT